MMKFALESSTFGVMLTRTAHRRLKHREKEPAASMGLDHSTFEQDDMD